MTRRHTRQSENLKQAKPKPTRSMLKQADVPAYSVSQALRVPSAIANQYGLSPTAPLMLAKTLDMKPSSSGFRMLCGASVAYGLTDGGYNVTEISVTSLGKRIIRPTVEGDDQKAKLEALLNPRVIGQFLSKYNNNPIPRNDIAKNVLAELGIPSEKTGQVLALITESVNDLGLIVDIKDQQYLKLGDERPHEESTDVVAQLGDGDDDSPAGGSEDITTVREPLISAVNGARKRRVFITHGKNRAFVEPLKKILTYGELEAVVSIEKQTVSQPVPEKVMNEMRSCGAAIIHVEAEETLLDKEANERIVLNPNVLIEIGAAIALYGKRFILLVKEQTKLPTNLQGLFEVRYSGDKLDGEVTMKLLDAINDMKKYSLPGESKTRDGS